MADGYFARLGHSMQMLFGSRFFVAVSGLGFIAFLSQSLFAPQRFPPFGWYNFFSLGLAPPPPPKPDLLPEVAEHVEQAKAAGLPYLREAVDGFFAANPGAIVIGNHVGLALSAAGLAFGLYMLAKQELRKA